MIRGALAVFTAVITIMTGAAMWLILATPRAALPVGFRPEEFAFYSLIQLSFGSVGLLLAARRPRNPIGWLFLATAFLGAWVELLAGYAQNAIALGRPEGLLVAWFYNWGPALFIGLLIAAIVLFPNGRPSTGSGRLALWLLPLGTLGTAAFVALRPGPMFNLPSVQNPYPLPPQSFAPALVLIATSPWLLAALVLFIRDLVTRFRAASGVLRQQLKWLLWSGSLIVAHLSVAGTVLVLGEEGPSRGLLAYLTRATFTLVIGTLPVALGVAVLRHRLYDIDLLIKRTIVYGGLSAVLVVIYGAFVILLGALLRPLTGGSEIAVAGSTLAVVALVQPLRGRIQESVDRSFYRSRYDAARTLDAFTSRLRDEVDIDAVRADVLDVIGETIRPAHAAVWIASPRSGSVSLSLTEGARNVSGTPTP